MQIPLSHIVKIAGRRFGRLVALSPIRKSPGVFYWACRCDCGKAVITRSNNLTCGTASSCGCLHTEIIRRPKTHGMSRKSSEHRIWIGMKSRCSNPNLGEWPKYGGRGITVCDRWLHSFENFYADMGPRPKGTSLDRIENSGNYEPGNCRWADLSTQARNSRKTPSVNRSRFKGVYWCGGKWQAMLRCNGKGHYLGSYSSQEEAAKAYDDGAIRLHGENAVTNADLGRL